MATIPNIPVALPGNKITAAYWNANVRDGVNYLMDVKPLTMLTQGVAQSVPTGVFTGVLFDTEVVDRDGQHDLSVTTDRIVIGKTLGWYKVSGVVAWVGNVTGTRRASVYFNGGQVTGSYCINSSNATFNTVVVPPTLVNAGAVTDYVTLGVFQDSGAALSTAVSGALRCSMVAEWVGR
jgi:hypothetical protein